MTTRTIPHAPGRAIAQGGLLALCLSAWLLSVCVEAAPVDTLQFGHIHRGMAEAEVVQRLGPPDRIAEHVVTLVPVWIDGRKELREKRRYVFIYTGDSQLLTSFIRLEDGRVVEKWKAR